MRSAGDTEAREQNVHARQYKPAAANRSSKIKVVITDYNIPLRINMIHAMTPQASSGQSIHPPPSFVVLVIKRRKEKPPDLSYPRPKQSPAPEGSSCYVAAHELDLKLARKGHGQSPPAAMANYLEAAATARARLTTLSPPLPSGHSPRRSPIRLGDHCAMLVWSTGQRSLRAQSEHWCL
jgi:hypothetical protein